MTTLIKACLRHEAMHSYLNSKDRQKIKHQRPKIVCSLIHLRRVSSHLPNIANNAAITLIPSSNCIAAVIFHCHFRHGYLPLISTRRVKIIYSMGALHFSLFSFFIKGGLRFKTMTLKQLKLAQKALGSKRKMARRVQPNESIIFYVPINVE